MRLRFLWFAVLVAFLHCPPPVRAEWRSFDSAGVKIGYLVEGEGDPVVLVHGYIATAQLNWGAPGVIKALAAKHRVIAIDARGHGRSGKPREVEKYGVEMVEDIVRLLDHLDLKQAHVVGYSMGGYIALKLVELHPDRVRTATLGGAGWEPASAATSADLDNIADAIENGRGLEPLIRRVTLPGRPMHSPEYLKTFSAVAMLVNDPKALAACARGMKKLAVPEEKLKDMRVPTLALVGEFDPLKTGADRLRGRLPVYREVVIEGADHMDAFLRPEFVRELMDFMAKHPIKERASGQ
jgi:pimeloyl-ACP methyl ester carboxylesterase